MINTSVLSALFWAISGWTATVHIPVPPPLNVMLALSQAAQDQIASQSTPKQPIEFNHMIHAKSGIQCMYCHLDIKQERDPFGVNLGPAPGNPSVSSCLTCHDYVATDNPEIKKLADYVARKDEYPWQPVYRYADNAHVIFRHQPHTDNNIGCEECHGDLTKATVTSRVKDLSMEYCLACHNQKGLTGNCDTCHSYPM